MKSIQRRTFIKQTSLLGLATVVSNQTLAQPSHQGSRSQPYVNFTRDGLDFSPEDYARRLLEISESRGIDPDSYSNHGVVEELENKMAQALGKEAAVYMPTGTLANHIAVRELAGGKTRVLVQAESHLYNDSGDCAEVLSHLNLIPLKPGETQFDLADVQQQVARAGNGKVPTGVGVISIESPVRRTGNGIFGFEEMKKISHFARANHIALHLDGARLFNAPAHTGVSVQQYAALFDTVYVSLYKNFNAASGAVLAGSGAFCQGLHHMRRMFGGGMPSAWPFAAVANEYVDSFPGDYLKALNRADQVFSSLPNLYGLEPLSQGSNLMKLHLLRGNPAVVRNHLLKENIKLNEPAADFSGFMIKINPSILRLEGKTLARHFAAAVG